MSQEKKPIKQNPQTAEEQGKKGAQQRKAQHAKGSKN